MTFLLQTLAKAWLENKEARIYLALLEYGSLPVSTLARITRIARPTIYPNVERLKRKWFITETRKNNILYYSCVDPKKIVALLRDKAQEAEKTVDLFTDQLNEFESAKKNFGNAPQVRYYEWEELLNILYSSLSAEDKELYTVFNVDAVLQHARRYQEKINAMLKESKTRSRVFLTSSPEAKKFQQQHQNTYQHIKLLPPDAVFQSDTIMTHDRFLYISYGDTITGIEIIDPQFLQTQKTLFRLLWDHYKK